MLMALDPEPRREMSNLLLRQAREQRKFIALFQSAEPSEVDHLGGVRAARSAFGTGGGRARRVAPEPS